MKKCLLDASSAILLFKSGLYAELVKTYEVLMTESVYHELTIDRYPGADTFRGGKSAGEVKVLAGFGGEVAFQSQISPGNLLDRGEFDTICCFKAGKGDFILIDDGGAAKYCRDHGIPFINALLFVKLLYDSGLISASVYEQKFNTLLRLGRYSHEIIKFARQAETHLLAGFLPE